MPLSNQLSQPTMRRFEIVRVALLMGAAIQAACVLVARLTVGDELGGPWGGMSFATALVQLLIVGGVAVSVDRRAAAPSETRRLPRVLLWIGAAVVFNEALGYLPVLGGAASPDADWRLLPIPGALLSSPQTLLLEALILTSALCGLRWRRLGWIFGGAAMALGLMFLLGRTYVGSGLANFSDDIFVSIPTSLSSISCAFAGILKFALERPRHSLWSQGIAANQLRFELFGRPAVLLALAMSQILLQSLIPESYVAAGVTVLIVLGIIANIEASLYSNRQVAKLEEALQQLADRDELTGLLSYRALLRDADALVAKCREEREHAHLLLIDVDGLKVVNDTWGHAAGSQLIQDVAELLRRTFRAEDVIGRYGGDEFVVVLASNTRDDAVFLNRLETQRGWLNKTLGRLYDLSVSVGGCHLDPDEQLSVHDALRIADAKMYEQKRARKRARVSKPLDGVARVDERDIAKGEVV